MTVTEKIALALGALLGIVAVVLIIDQWTEEDP